MDAQGIQDAATDAERDLESIETNAQDDVSQESSFIDSLMSAGVEAIIVSAVSADGSFRSIRRAHDAGNPVVCYNTCLSEADEPDQQDLVSAYAIGDPYEFGAKLGAARAVRSRGRVGDVVVFGGDMTAEIAAELERYDVIQGCCRHLRRRRLCRAGRCGRPGGCGRRGSAARTRRRAHQSDHAFPGGLHEGPRL
ncbi:substrate-binding domain-containing protein [Sagittula sp. S175]|uniref:substrate-binding domain-containing protein n=1 Tax=Sagittula sp. S175 TaxID=3415129 RepID=UPI003C7CA265